MVGSQQVIFLCMSPSCTLAFIPNAWCIFTARRIDSRRSLSIKISIIWIARRFFSLFNRSILFYQSGCCNISEFRKEAIFIIMMYAALLLNRSFDWWLFRRNGTLSLFHDIWKSSSWSPEAHIRLINWSQMRLWQFVSNRPQSHWRASYDRDISLILYKSTI